MKINKIIYLIIVFCVALFSFNCRVDAAQELTCLYKKAITQDKVLLIQYDDGSRRIFRNSDNKSVDGTGWFLNHFTTAVFEDDVLLDEDSNLKECPKYYSPLSTLKEIKFYNTHKVWETTWYDLYGGIDYSGELVNEPPFTSVIKPNFSFDLSDTQTCSSETWLSEIDGTRYTGACLYSHSLGDGKCHLIQINYGKENLQVTEYDPVKGAKYSGEYNFSDVDNLKNTGNVFAGSFGVDKNFSVNSMISATNGVCIGAIKVKRNQGYTGGEFYAETKVSLSGKGDAYYLINTKGMNPLTNEVLSMDNRATVEILKTEINSCEDLFGEEIAGFLRFVWNFVKILVPIVLVLLGGIDFAQAIFAGKDDGMKKAQSRFIKRIIIAVVIFLIPVILNMLLNVANSVWGDIGADICGILV